jgi:protein-S-isoprenylcysteine O-methyltransferase Ste14
MAEIDGAPRPCSRLLPPVWFLLAIGAQLGLHYWLPIAAFIPAPWNLGGWALIVGGLSLGVAASMQFRARQTTPWPTGRPTALVTGGIYRVTRNPMYLGLVIALAGLAVVLGTATPWVIPPLFALWIQHCFIRAEEFALEKLFGQAFLEYRSRVRRWI